MVIGGLILFVAFSAALLAPWLGTVDPLRIEPMKRLRPPSASNWFGTDIFGRDVWSRVIYGGRVSLIVGAAVAVISMGVGLAIGLVSGYLRRVDSIVMRLMDAMMAIPINFFKNASLVLL